LLGDSQRCHRLEASRTLTWLRSKGTEVLAADHIRNANRALIERYEEHSPIRTPRDAGVVAAPGQSRGRYTFVSDESVRPFPRSRILDHGGDLSRRSTGNAGGQLDCPCSAPLIPQLSPSELPLCPFDC